MDIIQDVATLRLWGTLIYAVLSLVSLLLALIIIAVSLLQIRVSGTLRRDA